MNTLHNHFKLITLLYIFLFVVFQAFGQNAGYSYKTIYSSGCMSIYVKCDYYWSDYYGEQRITTIANIYVKNNCSKSIKAWWHLYYDGKECWNNCTSGNLINGYDELHSDMNWRNYDRGIDPSWIGYKNVKWEYVDNGNDDVSGDLSLSGSWSYSYNFPTNSVSITGGKIENNRSGGKSGSLKIKLYFMEYKYSGENLTGYVIGDIEFDTLKGGTYYYNVNKNTTIESDPPTGSYYVSLALLEYDDGEYKIVDYLNFDGKAKVN